MRIIADSGSTQCTWILDTSEGTNAATRLRTAGINAAQHADEQIRAALAALPRQANVEEVYFYGAGCGPTFPEASERMRRILSETFATKRVTVDSDLQAAVLALYGDREGIACILGTGANSCHCRGGEILSNVPPLGYVLGDEGSGAVLGRNLLNGVFKGRIPLRGELLAACGMTYEEIIRRVYREPAANRFLASFAPFIREHIDMPQVRGMVLGAFRDFARNNLARYPAGLTTSFVGGIAAHFAGLLREALATEGYRVERIVESPAEGLLKYHHERQRYK